MAQDIFLTDAEFRTFIERLASFDLVRSSDHSSTFPFDFVLIYKNTYTFNFEYLNNSLQFYLIDDSNEQMKKELKERIEEAFR